MLNPVEFISFKALFFTIQSFISFLLVWAGIDTEVYTILTVLLLIDFVTGVWKAHSLGLRIRSNRMRYGIISKVSLLVIPIVIGLGAKALDQDSDILLFWAMNLLVLSEVYSVIGNIYCVRTGQEIPEYDALTAIAKGIRNKMSGGKDKV